MKSHEEIDTLIREALSEEEAAFHAQLEKGALYDSVTQLFAGRNRWLNLLGMGATLVFVALAAYAAYRYFGTADLAQRMTWAGLFFFSAMSVLGTKLWGWMEIERNLLTREIKRVELQLAHLASEIRRPS